MIYKGDRQGKRDPHFGVCIFTAEHDLEPYRRVKLISGSGSGSDMHIEYSNENEEFIGVTRFSETVVKKGERVSVNLKTTSWPFQVVASGVIQAGAKFNGAVEGKVCSSEGQNSYQGVTLGRSWRNGDLIEVLFY